MRHGKIVVLLVVLALMLTSLPSCTGALSAAPYAMTLTMVNRERDMLVYVLQGTIQAQANQLLTLQVPVKQNSPPTEVVILPPTEAPLPSPPPTVTPVPARVQIIPTQTPIPTKRPTLRPTSTEDNPCISYQQAGQYVDREVCVEGTVYDTYDSGAAFFINFDSSRTSFFGVSFDYKFYDLEGKCVRLLGMVEMYKGRPEIIIRDQSQVSWCR